MKLRYFVLGSIAFIVGWNIFLIQRDKQLFEAYDQATSTERVCHQQAGWHPDCNVE